MRGPIHHAIGFRVYAKTLERALGHSGVTRKSRVAEAITKSLRWSGFLPTGREWLTSVRYAKADQTNAANKFNGAFGGVLGLWFAYAAFGQVRAYFGAYMDAKIMPSANYFAKEFPKLPKVQQQRYFSDKEGLLRDMYFAESRKGYWNYWNPRPASSQTGSYS